MVPESISPTFTGRQMDDEAKGLMETANLRFSQLEELLNKLPNSCLKSIAQTELEKASLIVNKAISRKSD